MSKDALAKIAEQQTWLGPIEEPLQNGIRATFGALGKSGQPTRNFLHGTWLGHPVHVVLTDIPIGSWTAALVFDALSTMRSHDGLDDAAEVSIAVGLAGAVGAAVTGLNDWAEVDAKPRRVGLVHGLLNLSAATLFFSSLVARRRGSRSSGRGLAILGYLIATVSAKLGGTLVYEQRLGVDHSCERPLPVEFTAVLNDSDLPESKPTRAMAGETPVVLVRRSGEAYALVETCSHLGGPLSEGKLAEGTIQCPWHGSRFCVKSGRVMDGPAVHPQTSLEVRVRDGKIEVRQKQSANG